VLPNAFATTTFCEHLLSKWKPQVQWSSERFKGAKEKIGTSTSLPSRLGAFFSHTKPLFNHDNICWQSGKLNNCNSFTG